MKLESVTKIDKTYMKTSAKIDDDVMSANYDAIVNFPISGQFGAIWNPDFLQKKKLTSAKLRESWY